jgi:hypothetical protein
MPDVFRTVHKCASLLLVIFHAYGRELIYETMQCVGSQVNWGHGVRGDNGTYEGEINWKVVRFRLGSFNEELKVVSLDKSQESPSSAVSVTEPP